MSEAYEREPGQKGGLGIEPGNRHVGKAQQTHAGGPQGLMDEGEFSRGSNMGM